MSNDFYKYLTINLFLLIIYNEYINYLEIIIIDMSETNRNSEINRLNTSNPWKNSWNNLLIQNQLLKVLWDEFDDFLKNNSSKFKWLNYEESFSEFVLYFSSTKMWAKLLNNLNSYLWRSVVFSDLEMTIIHWDYLIYDFKKSSYFSNIDKELIDSIIASLKLRISEYINLNIKESSNFSNYINFLSKISTFEDLHHLVNSIIKKENLDFSQKKDLMSYISINVGDVVSKLSVEKSNKIKSLNDLDSIYKLIELSSVSLLNSWFKEFDKDLNSFKNNVFWFNSYMSRIFEGIPLITSFDDLNQDALNLLNSNWFDIQKAKTSTWLDYNKELLRANLIINDNIYSSKIKIIFKFLIDNNFSIPDNSVDSENFLNLILSEILDWINFNETLSSVVWMSWDQIIEFKLFISNLFLWINSFEFNINWVSKSIWFKKKSYILNLEDFNTLDDLNKIKLFFDFTLDELSTSEDIYTYLSQNHLIDENWLLLKDWLEIFIYLVLSWFVNWKSSVINVVDDLINSNVNNSSSNDLSPEWLDLNNDLSEVSELSKINEKWNDFEWDKSSEFKAGSVLAFRIGDSVYPWWWTMWWMMTIISDPEENENGDIVLNAEISCWETWEKLNKKLIFNYETFHNWLSSNPIYDVWMRFSKINSKEWFLDYIKSIELKSDYKKIKSWRDKWLNISINNDEFVNNKWEKIEYIWKDNEDFDKSWESRKYALLYSVKYEWNYVIVWNSSLNPSETKMSYNEFLLFCTEKQLNPYTKEEADLLDNKYWKAKSSTNKINWLSIWAMLMSFKTIKDNYVNKWKRADELSSSKFYLSLLDNKLLWLVPGSIIREMRQEAFSEYDSRIWSFISQHKDRLSREWWVHDKKIVEVIEKEIFDREWSIHKNDPLKAAWFLLHALDNAWWPYYRDLQKYSWKWKWVWCILWPAHKKSFLIELKSLLADANINSSDWELLNKIARLEIQYIIDNVWSTEMQKVFWSKFQWALDWWLNNWLFNSSKVRETHDQQKNKSTFDAVYNDFLWTMRQAVPAKQIWNLRALWEKIEDDTHYQKRYWAMLLPILSWEYLTWDITLKSEYMKIAWTYALPIASLVNDYSWWDKLAKLFDFIWEKRWYNSDVIFSSSVWWGNDKSNFLNLWEKRKKLINKINAWWQLHWWDIIRFLNMEDSLDVWPLWIISDLSLKSNLSSSENDVLWILNEYKENVLDKDKNLSYDSNLDPWEAVPYRRALFNMPPSIVEKNMIDHDWSKFYAPLWEWLWKMFNWKIQSISNNTDDILFEFVLTKYSTWFWRKHPWNLDLIQSFISASEQNDIRSIENYLFKFFESTYWRGQTNRMPANMKIALRNLSKYFANNISVRKSWNLLEKSLNSTLWEWAVQQAKNSIKNWEYYYSFDNRFWDNFLNAA